MTRRTMLSWLRRLLPWLVPGLLVPAVAGAACPPAPGPTDPAALAAAARTDRGLLWRVERDGRASYLYGTVHVAKPEWSRLGPAVTAALAATDVLALEIDPADPGTAGQLAAGDAPPPALPAALRERLARLVDASCVPPGTLKDMPATLQVLTLSVLEARWLGLDPAYAQEFLLAARARDAGHRVVALETVALQRRVLLPSDPKEALALVEGSVEQLESGHGRLQLALLARAWEQGDLPTLERYETWCDCARNPEERAALKAMLDDRNPGLADGIDRLHREGRRVFAAVGALHMAGPRGLPRLLAARGFTVERLAPLP